MACLSLFFGFLRGVGAKPADAIFFFFELLQIFQETNERLAEVFVNQHKQKNILPVGCRKFSQVFGYRLKLSKIRNNWHRKKCFFARVSFQRQITFFF